MSHLIFSDHVIINLEELNGNALSLFLVIM